MIFWVVFYDPIDAFCGFSWKNIVFFGFNFKPIALNNVFLANPTPWLQFHHSVDCIRDQFSKFISLLLLWQNGNRELWANDRLSLRITLARASGGFAEVFHFNDQKHTAPDILSWIRNGRSAIGNVRKCKMTFYFYKYFHSKAIDSQFFIPIFSTLLWK